jgi:hypothetical protein
MSPVVPVAGSNACFRFSSLGRDMPLFNKPVSQGPDITAPSEPFNVPDILLRRVLCEDIARILEADPAALNYDPGNSLALYIDGSLVIPSKIQVCDLSGPDGSWNNLPEPGSPFSASIDPELGRIALPPPAGANPLVQASFHYGFNADMGGGEYPRADSFSASPEDVVVRVPGDYGMISAAVNALAGHGVVEITDSGRYQEPGGMTVAVKANGHIELRAADGCRPTLVLGAEISVTGGAESMFDLNGLLVTYLPPSSGAPPPLALVHAPDAGPNLLSHLGLTHCTLVPGSVEPALLASPPGLEVVIQKSICGGLCVNGLATAGISDSIVDAADPGGVAYVGQQNQPGGALTLQGCTVIGKIYASLLTLISDSIVWATLAPGDSWKAPLWAARKQQGCVRFSYLPAGSIVPREFHCVEQAPGTPQPLFYSLRYGDPAYVKLAPATSDAILRGAEDGGEMGAFHFLLAPLRETDLRVRMREYIPVGLEFGIFYES